MTVGELVALLGRFPSDTAIVIYVDYETEEIDVVGNVDAIVTQPHSRCPYSMEWAPSPSAPDRLLPHERAAILLWTQFRKALE